MKKCETEKGLETLLTADVETLADHYNRIKIMIEFVESYFKRDIQETMGANVEALSLAQLKAILEPKIKHYSDYVSTATPGRFKRREGLSEWLAEGAAKRGLTDSNFKT